MDKMSVYVCVLRTENESISPCIDPDNDYIPLFMVRHLLSEYYKWNAYVLSLLDRFIARLQSGISCGQIEKPGMEVGNSALRDDTEPF